MPESRRYTFKLYPSRAQNDELHRQRLMCGELWNALIQRNEDVSRRAYGGKGVRHSEGKSILSNFDMGYEITTLLAECPEWRALSTWTPRRIAANVAKAYEAFFRRAKNGAGKEAGYPRYRRRDKSTTIPHRFVSGCKLLPRGSERSNGDEKPASARAWSLTLKGVPGVIRARGRFPVDPTKFTDADVIFRDRTWWLSACVEVPPRRETGEEKIMVRFDLIDEFACVERATGRRTSEAGSARAHEQNPIHSPHLA
jgi:hypothetical protein